MRKCIWGLLCCTILIAVSCKKYEDGPSISLSSRTSRVSNTWKVDKLLINGSDQTALAPANFLETFSKDGVYSYSYTSSGKTESGSGKWAFQNNDEQIKIDGVSGASSQTLYILRLKSSSFWFYFMDGNDKYEYHLIED